MKLRKDGKKGMGLGWFLTCFLFVLLLCFLGGVGLVERDVSPKLRENHWFGREILGGAFIYLFPTPLEKTKLTEIVIFGRALNRQLALNKDIMIQLL